MLPDQDAMVYRARRLIGRFARKWKPVTWRAQYSDSPYLKMIGADQAQLQQIAGVEPHDVVALGIARCPVSWDAITQRNTDPNCPTCYGTSWTGGYHPEIGMRMNITYGEFTVVNDATGAEINQEDIRATHLAGNLVLPGDLIVMNDSLLRYVVGQVVRVAGSELPMLAREVNLLPVLPTMIEAKVPVGIVNPSGGY